MPLDPVREGEAIGAWLLRRGRFTADQLDAARAEAAVNGGRLATLLYALGAVDLGSLTKALGEIHGMEAVPPERMSALDPAVVKMLPARVCLRSLAVAVRLSERGLDVAFGDPSDAAALRDVEKAAGRPVTAVVTAEPLVWYAFRVHGLTERIPKHLEPLVDELVSAGLSSAPKRQPVPAKYEEFHTTPLGGVAPHMPDEVTTASLREPSSISSPEELLGAPEAAFASAEATLDAARKLPDIASALLAFARTGAATSCVLRKVGTGYEPVDGTGALAGAKFSVSAATPTVLTAALAGETGYRGVVPPGSASLPLLGGRTPREVLILALCRRNGEEAILYVEAEAAPFDAAFVERMRVLSRRTRSALE